jgi:phosphoribosylglycinamide formyltransferase-1
VAPSPAAGSVSGVGVAVLASGSGTILEAMLVAGVPVVAVLADRPCRALQVAEEASVATELVDRRAWGGFSTAFDRAGYSAAMAGALRRHAPELVAMAGFGTVLDQPVHDAFPGRILNTHPALLPSFPGWHAVEDALAAGVKVTGCTVHVATLEMDAGPILAQEAVPVRVDDTVASLHERIKQVERRLYPATVLWALDVLAAGRALDGLAPRPAAEARA